MYGNYCGPYWSAGKWQTSVVDDSVEPVDDLDSHCRDHDAVYATGGDLETADIDFARRTVGKGSLPTAMGLLVGTQGLSRRAIKRMSKGSKLRGSNKMLYKDRDIESKDIFTRASDFDFEVVDMPPRWRGNSKPKPSVPTPAVLKAPVIEVPVKRKPLPVNNTTGKGNLNFAPVAMGGVVRSNMRRVIHEKYQNARIAGSSYGSRCNIRNSSSVRQYYLCSVIPMNPAHFTDRFAEIYSGMFEKYRFKNLEIEYFSESPTSVAGGIVICYVEDVAATLPTELNGGVLQQTMSQMNATWTNVWNHVHGVKVPLPDTRWRFTNTTVGKSLNDMYAGYIVAYMDVPAGTTDFGGNLAVHYDVEFESRTLVQPTNVPRSPGARAIFNIGSGTAGALVVCSLNTLAGVIHVGGVGMAYVDTLDSTLGTGPASFDALLSTQGAKGNVQLTSGSPIFFALHDVTGTVGNLYPDYESAVTDSNEIIYQTTTTTDTFLSVMGYWIISNPAIEA
jgi:hypothetical protein